MFARGECSRTRHVRKSNYGHGLLERLPQRRTKLSERGDWLRRAKRTSARGECLSCWDSCDGRPLFGTNRCNISSVVRCVFGAFSLRNVGIVDTILRILSSGVLGLYSSFVCKSLSKIRRFLFPEMWLSIVCTFCPL